MNIKTILLTGSRAPVTLDAARGFYFAGYRVICADSIAPTLSQFSSAVAKHYKIKQPAENLDLFAQELEVIIQKEKVDIVIPMCEEILFVSKIQSKLSCEVFSMDFELLEKLHNKWSFSKLIESFLVGVPLTKLVQSDEDIRDLPLDKKLIFKRIYSRFSAGILVKEKDKKMPKIKHKPENPYLVQEYIEGEKLCSYSIAQKGRLVAFSEYSVLQSIGIGAGVSFVSTFHDAIFSFVSAFVKRLEYTGQISFDFIIDKNGNLYCIECNPRATSGLHLFNKSKSFAHSFFQVKTDCLIPKNGIFKRDLSLQLWYGIKQKDFFRKSFYKSIFFGKNPLFSLKDSKPVIAIPLILFCIVKATLFQKKGFHEVMSRDVEYNGEIL